MVQRPQRMSRAARTARGAIGAALATILAATSHALAGGEVSAVSVAVTTIVALPICVALAGKVASTWRVLLAVGTSQFLFHWAFAGLGVVRGVTAASNPELGPHAAHLASLERFVPEVATAASADAVMWLFHALGAVISTVLITRGEQAVLALGRTLRRALPQPLALGMIQPPHAIARSWEAPHLCDQLWGSLSWSLRGPPAARACPSIQHQYRNPAGVGQKQDHRAYRHSDRDQRAPLFWCAHRRRVRRRWADVLRHLRVSGARTRPTH